MSTQYGFFIDSARCTGCKTCELACKDYKNLTPEVSFRRIYEYAGGDWQEDNGVWQQNVFAYYLSIACNHCEDPACTKVCPSGAMQPARRWFCGGQRSGVHWLPLLPYGLPVRRPAVQRRQRPHDQVRRLSTSASPRGKADLRRVLPAARCRFRADCRAARRARPAGRSGPAAVGALYQARYRY